MHRRSKPKRRPTSFQSNLKDLMATPCFPAHFISFSLMYSGKLSTLIVPGLPRHSMILSRLRITRLAGSGKVDLDPQPFAVQVVQHVQQPERPSITQPVGHEVHRPGDVRVLRHRQRIWFVPFQSLTRFDPQIQLQPAIDAVDAFVVPRMALLRCANAGNITQNPNSSGHRSAQQADRRSLRSRPLTSGHSDSRSR